MGKMVTRILTVAVSCWLTAASVSAQWVSGDSRTADQITRNATVAVGNESIYKIMNDTISDRRTVQAANVLFRQMLMLRDLEERTGLANFSKENRSYKRVIQQLSCLADNIEELMTAVRRHPENVWNYQQRVGSMLVAATESANNMIRLAMNSRVKVFSTGSMESDGTGMHPSSGSDFRNIDDGANLLSQIERVELIENCIGELRAMNRALRSVIWRLNTEVHWTYMFRQVSPYHYGRIRSLNFVAGDALDRAKRFDPFK